MRLSQRVALDHREDPDPQLLLQCRPHPVRLRGCALQRSELNLLGR
jgi:hypothetical protein